MATERESLPELETSINQLRESSVLKETRSTEIEAIKVTDGFVEDPNLALDLLREQERLEGLLGEERGLLNSLKDKALSLIEPYVSTARDYLDSLELRNLQMEELKRHHLAGRLTDELLGHFEENYTKFVDEPNTNPELGSTIRLLQLYPELAERTIETPVVITPPEKGPEPEVPEKPFILPDGQEITAFTKQERQLAELLKRLLEEEPPKTAHIQAVIQELWPKETNIDVAKKRLGVIKVYLNRKLADKNWKIVLVDNFLLEQAQEIAPPKPGVFYTLKTIDQVLNGSEFGDDEIAGRENEPKVEIEYSSEEKAALARLLINRSQLPIKIGEDVFRLELVDDSVVEACQRLYEAVYEIEDTSVNIRAEEIRSRVLEKVEKLFRDERAEDRVLEIEGDFGRVLFGLLIVDEIVIPSHLFEFLRAGLDSKEYSNDVYEWIKKLIKYEADRVQTTKFATEVREPKPTIMFEKIAVGDLQVVETNADNTVLVTPETTTMQVVVKETSVSVSREETRKSLRTLVQDTIGEISKYPFPPAMDGATLTNRYKEFFGKSVRETELERYRKWGYITPVRTASNHYNYGLAELLIVKILTDNGKGKGNLDKKELLKVIDEEMKR